MSPGEAERVRSSGLNRTARDSMSELRDLIADFFGGANDELGVDVFILSGDLDLSRSGTSVGAMSMSGCSGVMT